MKQTIVKSLYVTRLQQSRTSTRDLTCRPLSSHNNNPMAIFFLKGCLIKEMQEGVELPEKWPTSNNFVKYFLQKISGKFAETVCNSVVARNIKRKALQFFNEGTTIHFSLVVLKLLESFCIEYVVVSNRKMSIVTFWHFAVCFAY